MGLMPPSMHIASSVSQAAFEQGQKGAGVAWSRQRPVVRKQHAHPEAVEDAYEPAEMRLRLDDQRGGDSPSDSPGESDRGAEDGASTSLGLDIEA